MTGLQDKGRVAYGGLLLAFALVLSYVETLIPFFFGVPGMKLGLANLAVLLTLYLFGEKEALGLNIGRIVIASFLFGNMSMLLYSAAGGIVSFFMMAVMKRSKRFGMIGVSMGGGVLHNLGQLAVAFLVTETKGIFYYMPMLLLAGIGAGFLNGIIAAAVYPHLPDVSAESGRKHLKNTGKR